MLVLLMTAVTGAWANVTEAVQGDVNEDGVVDVADIAAIVAVMNGDADYDNADVNTDGSVNVADIVFVTNIIAGQSATNGTGTAVITANAITAVNGGDAVDLVINLDYQTAKKVVGASFTLYLPDGLLLKGFDTPEAQAAGKASALKNACDLGEDGVWSDDADNDWLTITKRSDGGLQFTLIDTSVLTPFESTHSKLITIQVHAVADVQGQAYIKNVSLASKDNASLDKGNLADSNFGVNEATTTPKPPVPTGYTVSMKEDTEDAANWQAKAGQGQYQQLPLSGVEAGTVVSLKYDGRKRVRGVKAVKKTAAAPAGTDLSMVDCAGNARASQWTANCYMVHTAGDYYLPLVYGNAIKDGTDNTAAYTGVENSNTTLTFPRHDGEAITAPWIKDNGITVTQAELLWQDAKGLITKVGIDGDYLTLTVGKDAADQEGNAMVAAKTADGTIVWSWHIWVTRQTFADLTTVATGSHDYQLTPVNVGWVGTPFGKGYSPYYQWGRKDAFIPADITVVDMEQPEETPTNTGSDSGSSSGGQVHVTVDITLDPFGTIHYTNNHSVYDIDDKAVTGFTLDNSTSTTIAANIKDPTRFWYKADNTSCNMWNAQTGSSANVVSSATVKTVYDPCPPGFCVPTDNLYNYVVSADNKSNFGWNDDRKGFILKTSTAKVLFPFLGKREDTEKAEEVDIDGYYWSATGFEDKNGKTAKALYIHRDNTRNYSSLTRVNGHPVRAVAEE